jgi:hypothetical protein
MSGQPKIYSFPSIDKLVVRMRDDFRSGDKDFILLYAYNGTGKTRLSTEFKNKGKRLDENGNVIEGDTLYFNAFTEDLFYWDNDLENDLEPRLLVNSNSSLISGFSDLSLDENIVNHFQRHCSVSFEIIRYSAEEVEAMASPSAPSHHLYQRFGNELETKPKYIRFKPRSNDSWIKISRGEERIFVWSIFLSFIEQVLKGESSYSWVRYVYIDDPVSSLDDNNAIAVAADLAKVLHELKKRSRRDNSVGDSEGASDPAERDPVKVIVSSHHALFFNVIFNELKRAKCSSYFLYRSTTSHQYMLSAIGETPFFHHVAQLSELRDAAASGALFTYHFNILRSILEKTAIFFGKEGFSSCLEGVEGEALYSRALNLLSHGKYSLYEPMEMMEENKQLFRDILAAFLNEHQFYLPTLVRESAAATPPPNVVLSADTAANPATTLPTRLPAS